MSYLAIGLTTIWLIGILVFAGRFLNFIRLLYNNLDPAKDFSRTSPFGSGWFFKKTDAWAIDPQNLTELGRQYQQQAMRDERRAVVWGVGGFAILTGLLAPNKDSLIAIGFLVAVLGGFYLWGRRIRRGSASKFESVLARGLDALMLFR